jgi:DtxR family transcriptional regulator, Mn-dependent transcriptional regulator
MNQIFGGPNQNQGQQGRKWNGREDSSELHRREEILELLWTMREKGPVDLQEFLKRTEEENAEQLLGEMAKERWISIQEGELSFLEEGEQRAKEIIRRHRLAERLLSEVFELEESSVESSACQFEHILSSKVLDSVCTFLGHPPTCPHGRPIPRGPCCSRFQREVVPLVRPLEDLKLGEEGRVVFMTPKSRHRLERLISLGLSPGSVIRLAQRRPSFVLEVGETTLALDVDIVKEIYVRRV